MNPNFPNYNLNLELSLEQKFNIKLFENSVKLMNAEEMRSLLMEASKLLMVKDNIIKGLMKDNLNV